ncbi:MAG: serine hydrolase [Anaerolineae bacterium]|nr:serine hydrolase [Anaerolineae bacterium]
MLFTAKQSKHVRRLTLALLIVLALSAGSINLHPQAQSDPTENYQLAASYSSYHNGDAVLILQDGEIVYEDYQNGYSRREPHLLASGTKSFSCAIAAAAVEDGLISLDEKVADTLTEWQGVTKFPYEDMTVYQLLTQTSGLPNDQGILGQAKDRLKVTLLLPLTFPPGEYFQYAPANYYAFATVMNRKLEAADTGDADVIAYLQRRIFDPLEIKGFDIRRDSLDLPNLAAGGLLTAREWIKYGQFILQRGMWEGEQIVPEESIRQCFVGTAANPYYAMSMWVEYNLKEWIPLEVMATQLIAPNQSVDGVTLGETEPTFVIFAGEGQQRMYIIPERNLVVLRFGRNDSGWSDADFLSIIMG